MKLIFLGSGTSVGVPSIGCSCPVCTSGDPRNKRLRASIYIETDGFGIIVDTSPDFRTQVLAQRVPRVDAVVLTHSHADHILGFDDIRRFNTIQNCIIPVYGSPRTIADMNRIFGYVHAEHLPGLFRPRVEFREVTGPFDIGPVRAEPFTVPHGNAHTYGYRFEAGGRTFGYFPDCREMPDDVLRRLAGLDVMILDALRHKPHATHFCVEQSLAVLEKIGAGKSFITHMCHDVDHAETEKTFPDSIRIAYDGLALEW